MAFQQDRTIPTGPNGEGRGVIFVSGASNRSGSSSPCILDSAAQCDHGLTWPFDRSALSLRSNRSVATRH